MPNATCVFLYLLVTTGYLVDTGSYLVVTCGYSSAITDHFWLLLLTSRCCWFLVLVTMITRTLTVTCDCVTLQNLKKQTFSTSFWEDRVCFYNREYLDNFLHNVSRKVDFSQHFVFPLLFPLYSMLGLYGLVDLPANIP